MTFYTTALRPALFAMDAERAHDFTIGALAAASVFPGLCREAGSWLAAGDPSLGQTVFGKRFANPIGLGAGLDKNGVAVAALAALGFGHVEIGTVTGRAQPGNPQPRLFRLKADHGIINRMGFNNRGCEAMAAHLAQRWHPAGGTRRPPCVLGINLGKSKVVDNAEALADYEASIHAVGRYADYLVINVSSPNTPGLRDLQAESALRPLLAGVRACVDRAAGHAPLLLKIAPDLSDAGIDAAIEVALATGCDGIIATNTTITRDGLATPLARLAAIGAGGLSGQPVRERATRVLARVARRVRAAPRQIPIIGVGGVDSVETAWQKLTHGATLVQVYSALIYEGPGLIAALNHGLAERVGRLGLRSITEVIGRDL